LEKANHSRRKARFENFELDLRAGELRREGDQAVQLSEQPFRILAMLLARPGDLVTREEIRSKLWPNGTIVEFEHSISAAMNRLRQALGDSPENPLYIETLARRGYRWKTPVEWVESPLEVAGPAEAELVETPAATGGNMIGKKVSHYRVLELLGGGGMGGPMGGGPVGGGRRGGQGPGGPQPEEPRADGKKTLERISKETGGRLFEVSKKLPIDEIYAQIEDELRNQYNLGYTPDRTSTEAPGYRKIEVTTTQRELTVQARKGYYAGQ